MELVLAVLVALGLALVSVMALAQRRQLLAAPPVAAALPPVSILKPLKGVDAELEANLESFMALDYPSFELLLGVQRSDDPAVAVARRVAARHPQRACRVVVDAREAGLNPKVNNLMNLERRARHELLLVSDSNVRASPDYLRALVAELQQTGVRLVSSPFRGVGGRGLGAACEGLQLNTFVMGGAAAVHRLWGGVCVVGKSMLLRRSDLAGLGGFSFLARFLAEDQVCGEEIAARGGRVALSGLVIDNVLARQGVRDFLARHLRWAKIRRRMHVAAYAGELLLNPVFLALAGCAARPNLVTAATLLLAVIAKASLDASCERLVGVRRPLLAYPPLVLLKDALLGIVWVVPFVDAKVRWRGNRLRVGPRTLLSPRHGEPAASPLEAVADLAASRPA
jgi:ceramide glucosyltransferase